MFVCALPESFRVASLYSKFVSRMVLQSAVRHWKEKHVCVLHFHFVSGTLDLIRQGLVCFKSRERSLHLGSFSFSSSLPFSSSSSPTFKVLAQVKYGTLAEMQKYRKLFFIARSTFIITFHFWKTLTLEIKTPRLPWNVETVCQAWIEEACGWSSSSSSSSLWSSWSLSSSLWSSKSSSKERFVREKYVWWC